MTNSSSVFTFSQRSFRKDTGEASFEYELIHKGETFRFSEMLNFPLKNLILPPEKLLNKMLDSLHLVFGMNYWKLFCPKVLNLPHIKLSKTEADFWNRVYTKGLAEFFYKNEIDFRDLLNFPFTETESVAIYYPRGKRSLVGIGGGKDSIVTAELLKKQAKPFTPLIINSHQIQKNIVQKLDTESIIIDHKIDPLLLTLNKRADSYNGHVPVSAQYAFIGLIAALFYDYSYFIVSNEHSANYGNTFYLGEEINHQWSKSLEFEKMLQEYMREFITADIIYFSLLRQMSELKITEQFVRHQDYFPLFSSCNKNFRIKDSLKDRLWCGECPKCAFVFTMLAAFLKKEELLSIFGENLFAKEALLDTFKALLGVVSVKPWECVGTPKEVKVAFGSAQKSGEYTDDLIMRFFKQAVLPGIHNFSELEKQVLTLSGAHAIPEEFLELIPEPELSS